MPSRLNQHTVEEIARDQEIWEEYFDPANNAPFAEFTEDERIEMVKECYPAAVNASIDEIRRQELEARYGPAETW